MTLKSILHSPQKLWRLPGPTDRTSIVGKTGCGKTSCAAYLLSEMRLYETMPWIIIDYKGDSTIAQIPSRPLKATSKVPTEPGIYRLECSPFLNKEDPVEEFLKRVWDNGNTGLFFDEAYMLPDRYSRTGSGTLRALFTTGRSRHIPILSLTQRPVDVIRYNFSEASHHIIFRLPDKADRDTVRGRVPNEKFDEVFGKNGNQLPLYHSLWYDVEKDNTFVMLPFPHPDDVIAKLNATVKINKWV